MKAEQAPFLAFGIICCAASCGFFVHSLRRRRRWSSGDGVILGYREDYDASFFPKVQFRLPNGDEITFESRCSGSPKRSPVGSRVQVLYSPEDPSNAEVLSFSSFWLLPIFSLGFGLIFTLVGILVGICV
jgi:hypothetical protein